MSLYADPQEHAANPPESWEVRKAGPRWWQLVDQSGNVLGRAETKRAAEELKVSGFYFKLWHQEARWYAGETVYGWKPYVPVGAK
jgi:hypothetical protein